MRILITRPAPEARATALRLLALGHAPLLAPLTEIAPLPASWPEGRFAAALATSAHAFGIGPPPAGLPLHVVGARAAQAALTAGWPAPGIVAPDASALAEALLALFPEPTDLLYLAGRDRKPHLEQVLQANGHRVLAIETYAAIAAAAPPPALVEAALSGAIDAALHYSRRSAEIFAGLAQAAGFADTARGWRHYCLSDDVAAGLTALGAGGIRVAEAPNEASLLAALRR